MQLTREAGSINLRRRMGCPSILESPQSPFDVARHLIAPVRLWWFVVRLGVSVRALRELNLEMASWLHRLFLCSLLLLWPRALSTLRRPHRPDELVIWRSQLACQQRTQHVFHSKSGALQAQQYKSGSRQMPLLPARRLQ